MRDALLVIGGRPLTIEAAERLGIDTVNIQHPSLVGAAPASRQCLQLYMDYTDLHQLRVLVRALGAGIRFVGALSLTEPGSVPAGVARSELGLPGHGAEVSTRLVNKLAMRRAVAGTDGLVDVAAAACKTGSDIEAFAAEHGYPVIVKPVDGTASIGIHAVHSREEAARALEELERLTASQTRRFRDFFPLGDYMVEQLVEGPEYSVETFSTDGHHEVVGVTEKLTTDDYLEAGHVFPARCPDDVESALADATARFLTAVGLTDGPSHTELRMTPRGPAVIESHDRVGGDRILDLVRHAAGFDMEEAAVAWAARQPVTVRTARPGGAHPTAATAFAFGPSGLVAAIGPDRPVRDLDLVRDCFVDIAPGQAVGTDNGNWDRLGQVITVSNDPDAAVAAAARAAHRLAELVEVAR